MLGENVIGRELTIVGLIERRAGVVLSDSEEPDIAD